MSHLIRCDHCGKDMQERFDTYFTLKRGGDVVMLNFGDHPGPWHLCSWKCLSRLAFEHDQPEVGVDEE